MMQLAKIMSVFCLVSFAGCIQQDSHRPGTSEPISPEPTAEYNSEMAASSDVHLQQDGFLLQSLAEATGGAENEKTGSPTGATDPEAAVASCPSNGLVAFSVTGNSHTSYGDGDTLVYSIVRTNLGGGWDGSTTFTAPCTGLYLFAVSFVKDAYYYGGTTDDVSIDVIKDGASIGSAWSGEGTGMRGTGAYTVALYLNAGSTLHTRASSDGGRARHVATYNFTGILIKQ